MFGNRARRFGGLGPRHGAGPSKRVRAKGNASFPRRAARNQRALLTDRKLGKALPLVPPEGSLPALAPQSLSSARRPKREFSGSPQEASRRHQERGALKWSRPHPGRPSGGLRGGGGRGAPRGFLAIPRGFDQNEGASQSVPWRPQNPSGESSRPTLFKTQSAREPLRPTRSPQMPRGHRGEGARKFLVAGPIQNPVEI